MGEIKDIPELKAALEKVSETINKGMKNKQLCALERDIALERLRNIYEALLVLDFCEESPKDILPLAAPVKQAETEKMLEEPVSVVNDYIDLQHTDCVEEACLNPKEVQEEEAPQTMEELIEKPFVRTPPISREVIESLYGSDESYTKKEETTEPENKQQEIPQKQVVLTEEFIPEEPEPIEKVLNEMLADGDVQDVASMLSAQNASQLKNVIGLNDRLMLMRDIFNNNKESFEAAIHTLDQIDNIDDAFIYLYENFTIDDTKEGVKLLISLLEKKFA